MIGLVADIAHRTARLNPHLGESAAIETPGIVLIDEVDMHLHPQWQQVVLKSLEQAFPLLQFIVTTHSPQVLTTLRKENIRIFSCDEQGKWTAPEPATSPLAHESGDALAHIMGTHPRPEIQNVLPDLHAYELLARAGKGDTNEAREIQKRLDAAGFEFNEAERALFDYLTHKVSEPDQQ
jgi:predicted ATP-binding protein involved in virulence